MKVLVNRNVIVGFLNTKRPVNNQTIDHVRTPKPENFLFGILRNEIFTAEGETHIVMATGVTVNPGADAVLI